MELGKRKRATKNGSVLKFINSVSTCKFIEALIAESNEDGLGQNCPKIDNQVVKRSKVKEKGKAGRPKEAVWMHPILFAKFAMWINPRFEVKAIRFIYDEMIRFRNLAGDSYPSMCKAVRSILPEEMFKDKIKDLARSLNIIVYGYHETGMRDKISDEAKVREMHELEHQITQWINLGLIRNYEQLREALYRLFFQKHPNTLPIQQNQ